MPRTKKAETVTYIGRYDEVAIEVAPSFQVTVKKGESVEVTALLANSLLEQPDNWVGEDSTKKIGAEDADQ